MKSRAGRGQDDGGPPTRGWQPGELDNALDDHTSPGSEVALVDAGSRRALAVAQDMVGLVEIGEFAHAYPRHYQHFLAIAELLAAAKEQLAPPDRSLADLGLREKIRDAAVAWVNDG